MSDEKLIEEAQADLGDGEQVLAAGIFQPRGTSGGMGGAMGAGLATNNIVGELAGAAASVEAGRAMSHVDGVRGADDRVATDADAGREAEVPQLVHHLVGQRARLGNQSDASSLGDVSRNDAGIGLPR